MADAFNGHRPGHLKQQNKGHKHGRHKSKGAANDGFKVRVLAIRLLAATSLIHAFLCILHAPMFSAPFTQTS